MNELATLDYMETEAGDVGSFNHSTSQANLTFLLKRLGQYSVSTDLSLNISGVDLAEFDIPAKEEIKPDVCIYPKRKMNPAYDILRMTEMPLLAVEILSPRQGVYEISEKFKLYFALGIKSCWLVIPNTQTVTVYSSIEHFTNFTSGDVMDDVFDIRVPIDEIFD